jgi:SAM-dependent methyltransferase
MEFRKNESTIDRITNTFQNYKNLSTEQIVFFYCSLLEQEIHFRKENKIDFLPLKIYYKHLFTENDQLMSVGCLGFAHRLEPIIEELKNRPKKTKILDAGSGYGTESFLFTLMGKEVHGIELVPARVEMANSRVEFFQSFCNFPLKIKFINANIFKYLQTCESFDIIWIMEAISHIYPSEKFLQLALEKLNKDGKIIITDPNKINPLAWLRSIKIRGSIKHTPHQKFKDPETHKPVDYGQEKIYTMPQIKKLLRKINFKVEKIQFSGFMGTSFLPKSLVIKKSISKTLATLQKIIRKIPILRSLGSIYTIVAAKKK